MRLTRLALPILAALVLADFAWAVVRLERYREANALGICDHVDDIEGDLDRVERERCLESAPARGGWLAALVAGLR